MNRELVPGGIYRHFKNKLYMVRGVVIHSETGEKMVLYQALYGDFRSYVRPYDMFLSEVDHDKYPDAPQKYRFTRVLLDETGRIVDLPEEESVAGNAENSEESAAEEETDITEGAPGGKDVGDEDAASHADEETADEEAPDPLLLEFLDLPNLKEKVLFLNLKRNSLSERTLASCAAAMDIRLPQGDISEQFTALRDSLLMRARYEENDRLR
jgi:hypothetical protein